MAKIFISYSSKDDAFARHLASRLAEASAEVWIDTEDIPVGAKWSKAIQVGLDDSEVMLVIISPDSMESGNVEDEWQYYLDHNKPVVPVLYRPAKVHFQLNRIQYVDFYNLSFEDAFRKLHTELALKGIRLAPLPALPVRSTRTVNTILQDLKSPNSSIPQRYLWGGMVALVFIVLGVALFMLTRGPSPADQGEDFLKALSDENIGIARDLVCEEVRDQIQVGQLWGLEMENISCRAGNRANWISCSLEVNDQPVSTEFLVNDDNLICGGEY